MSLKQNWGSISNCADRVRQTLTSAEPQPHIIPKSILDSFTHLDRGGWPRAPRVIRAASCLALPRNGPSVGVGGECGRVSDSASTFTPDPAQHSEGHDHERHKPSQFLVLVRNSSRCSEGNISGHMGRTHPAFLLMVLQPPGSVPCSKVTDSSDPGTNNTPNVNQTLRLPAPVTHCLGSLNRPAQVPRDRIAGFLQDLDIWNNRRTTTVKPQRSNHSLLMVTDSTTLPYQLHLYPCLPPLSTFEDPITVRLG